MIIGVDAGALSITDERLRVGVWRVTYNFLKELAIIDKKNEYRLYSFLPIPADIMKAFGTRMQNFIVRPTIGWSRIQLPIEMRRRPVDVFLGLSQMVPVTSAKKIGFIYDVGFVRFPKAYPGSLRKLEGQTKQLVGRSDQIVTISKATQEDVKRVYSIGKKPIHVCYPGIDERFAPYGTVHKETHPYFLFVGALKRGKNVPLALRIFKRFLEATNGQYVFLIVGGDYWADPEILTTIQELDLTHHVKIVGFVPDQDLPKYYRGATALIITSLWEGFCLPVVEAMASGCPVVYAKNGSLPEIADDAGASFPPEDERRGVELLIKLSSSTQYRRKLVTAGLKRAKIFHWETFAKRVYAIIASS